MSGFTRRSFGAGFAAAGFMAFAGGSVRAAGPIILQLPMRLSRRIVRALGESERLVIYREWEVGFAMQGRGIAITGSQTLAKVASPEHLRPIAQIEESRSTDDMWPILLSGEGRIMAAGEYTRDVDLVAAVQAAEQVIKDRGEPLSAQKQHKRYIAQIERASGTLIEQLPPDLFFPTSGDQELVRSVTLPDGSKGEFVVSYTASTAQEGAWLSRATRKFTTRIGSETRESSEEWRLSAI